MSIDLCFFPLQLVSTHLYIYHEAEKKQKAPQLLLEVSVFSLSYCKRAKANSVIMVKKNSTHSKYLRRPANPDGATAVRNGATAVRNGSFERAEETDPPARRQDC